MFGKIGTGELLIVLIVALVIFGPAKLPALGKMAGKAIGTLRHYADSNNWDELLEEEVEQEASSKAKAKKTAAAEEEETQETAAAEETPAQAEDVSQQTEPEAGETAGEVDSVEEEKAS